MRERNIHINYLKAVCIILMVIFHLASIGDKYPYLKHILSQCRLRFQSVFQPSLVAIFPLMILCRYPENLNRYSLAGILITYLSISFLLWAYRYIPHRIKHILHFIGRNTLSILLFSPIFIMLSKMLIPLFVYDSSGVSFTCVAVTFVITGCFLIARSMDKWKLSRFFCGRRKLIMN